jgi:hypothetical protein
VRVDPAKADVVRARFGACVLPGAAVKHGS